MIELYFECVWFVLCLISDSLKAFILRVIVKPEVLFMQVAHAWQSVWRKTFGEHVVYISPPNQKKADSQKTGISTENMDKRKSDLEDGFSGKLKNAML